MTALEERKRGCSMFRINVYLYVKMVFYVKWNPRCYRTIMNHNLIFFPVIIHIFKVFLFYYTISRECIVFPVFRVYVFLNSRIRSVVENNRNAVFPESFFHIEAYFFRRNHTINSLIFPDQSLYIVINMTSFILIKGVNHIRIVLTRRKCVKYYLGILTISEAI